MGSNRRKRNTNRETTMSDTETKKDDTADQSGDQNPIDATETPDADTPAVVEDAPTPAAPPAAETAPPAPAATSTLSSSMIDPAYRDEFDLITEQFQRYATNMAKSRPIEEADGVRQQLDLWKLIQTTLAKEGPAFNVLFAHLLDLMFREREGALHVHRRYRFFGSLPLGAEEARNFESILQAFMTLADPQSRVLKSRTVNLAHVFLNYSNKAAEARVIDFFAQ